MDALLRAASALAVVVLIVAAFRLASRPDTTSDAGRASRSRAVLTLGLVLILLSWAIWGHLLVGAGLAAVMLVVMLAVVQSP